MMARLRRRSISACGALLVVSSAAVAENSDVVAAWLVVVESGIKALVLLQSRNMHAVEYFMTVVSYWVGSIDLELVKQGAR